MIETKELNDTCVYMHHKATNGEIFYVGIGNIERPYDFYQRSRWWKDIVKIHGIIVNICETDMSWSESCDKEINLIKTIGRRDKGLGLLVNMTDGGDGNKNPSYEVRKKMSESKKKLWENIDYKNNMVKIHTGRKASEETKEKMRIRMSGENHFNFGKKYPKDRCNKMKDMQKEIWKREGYRKHMSEVHMGFKPTEETLKRKSEVAIKMWKNLEYREKIKNRSKIPVIQLCLDDSFIKEWDCATSAMKELNIDGSSITKCCKGKLRAVRGFKWKYKSNYNGQ